MLYKCSVGVFARFSGKNTRFYSSLWREKRKIFLDGETPSTKLCVTFQINVAVTNFAPERMYQINADSLRTVTNAERARKLYCQEQSNQISVSGSMKKTLRRQERRKRKKWGWGKSTLSLQAWVEVSRNARRLAPVLGRQHIAIRTEYLEVCRHLLPGCA